MDLWSIVKTVGTGLISTMVPGGAAVIGAINAFLPDDAKLPENATGQQAQDALATLSPADRATVMNKQFDVQITQIKESHETTRAMLTADATMPQTTRPFIAKWSFMVIAFSVTATTVMWMYAVAIRDAILVKAIMDGWPFIVGVNGTLATLLLRYFGVLQNEQKNKLDAAAGISQPSGLAGLLTAVLKK